MCDFPVMYSQSLTQGLGFNNELLYNIVFVHLLCCPEKKVVLCQICLCPQC